MLEGAREFMNLEVKEPLHMSSILVMRFFFFFGERPESREEADGIQKRTDVFSFLTPATNTPSPNCSGCVSGWEVTECRSI